MTDNIVFNIFLIFFIAAPIFQGTVSYLLWRAMRAGPMGNPALLERFVGSLALFASSLAVSLLAVNRLFPLHLDNLLAVLVLLAALAFISVPAFIWLSMYYSGKFGRR